MRSLRRLKITTIISVIILAVSLIGMAYNLFLGNSIFPPYQLEAPVVLTRLSNPLESQISIDYPESWRVDEYPNGNRGDDEHVASIHPAGTFPSIDIFVNTPITLSLEEIAAWGEERITWDNYNLLSLEEIEIDSKPALLRTYTVDSFVFHQLQTQKIYCYHVYAVRYNSGYIVELCSNDKSYTGTLRTVFEDIIDSISFN